MTRSTQPASAGRPVGVAGMGLRVSMALTVALAAALPGAAHADRDARRWGGDIRHFDRHDRGVWRRGSWHHGHHDGRLGWWWVVGGIWYFYPRPVYPYPDPYVPPVVVQQSPVYVQQPPEYVQQPSAAQQPVPSASQTWYYCDQARGYYPYVRECPGGWKPVPATPPR